MSQNPELPIDPLPEFKAGRIPPSPDELGNGTKIASERQGGRREEASSVVSVHPTHS
jgi:hypothetical protein